MKKFVNILTALVCMLCLGSCGHKNYMLLDMIPADSQFVAVFSPTAVAGNAGVSVNKDNTMQFPQAFTESIPASAVKDIEAVNNFLSGSGIDLDSMAVYLPSYQDKPVYVVKLKDTKWFVDRLSENGYKFIRGQLGVKIYASDSDSDSDSNSNSSSGPVVSTRDNIAVMVFLDYEDIDDMWRCFYRPDENPLSRSTGPGSFIIGDPSEAELLPDEVRSFITTEQPESIDVLLFAKTLMGIR